jgi:nickel-type superoxide dismutase maturation protease
MTPPSEVASTETYHRPRKAIFALVGAAVIAVIRLRPFRVEVAGESMSPALEPGDWCVATAGGRIKVGDVVVLEPPDRPGVEVVKRVTGGPGDEGLGFGEWFVEGDNPDASTDSRQFGPIPRPAIKGRVRFVYRPAGAGSDLSRPWGPGLSPPSARLCPWRCSS